MPNALTAARQQLARVYELMYVEGKPGYEQISFAESTFSELASLLELLPGDAGAELLVRLSDGVPALKVAELFNVLIWSADARGHHRPGRDPGVVLRQAGPPHRDRLPGRSFPE